MNNIDILNTIQEQIELERKKILEPASKKAQEVIAKAKAEAERISAKTAQAGKPSAAAKITKVSPLVLKAKQEGIDQVFSKALEELENKLRNKPEYGQILEKLLREAHTGFQGTVDILVNPQDVKLAQDAAAKLNISGQVKADAKIGAGVTVSQHGTVFNHNTFAERCKKVKIICCGEVANILYA